MSREIKFRGLRYTHARLLDCVYGIGVGKSIDSIENDLIIRENGWSKNEYMANIIMVRPDTIGQFTEFHDENGKEIYEGDIIEHPKGDIGYVFMSETGQWKVRYKDDIDYALFLQIGDKGQGVVVGNIYQNPELLEVQND